MSEVQELGFVLGFRTIADKRMKPGQFALVDDDGHGVAFEGGEVTPCILPPPPPRLRIVPLAPLGRSL